MPFFTVIIPTRNRPDLVSTALQSVLEQDFDDFEVIVSDNSDEAESRTTRAALRPLLGDSRARYTRPERVMPMVEHWEWVTRQAEGQFTGVLTDRMSYRLYTLRRCNEALSKHATDLVSFRANSLGSNTPPYALTRGDDPADMRVCRSAHFLADCSRARISMTRLPRMLNSFCRTSSLNRLIEEYGSIYTGLAPDFSFCFRILDQVETFVSLDDRLLVSGGEDQSNGFALTHNKPNSASLDFLARSGNGGWLAYAPITASVPIGANFIMLEYEVARRQQRSGSFALLDKAAFYHQTQRKLQKLVDEGHEIAAAVDALETYRVEHDIPRTPPRLVDRVRRQWLIRSMRLSRIPRTLRALGPHLQAGLAAATGRSGPSNLREFPTVIELLRYDAATAAQTTG